MFRFVFIWTTTTWLVFAGSARACTAFCLQKGQELYVSKNLDWSIDDGYAFLNERGLQKSILITGLFSKNEFNWVSKYRSLTFNQFGKEFPLGGINEHGLVVEELNAVPVPMELNDSARLINEFQLTQFLLDNCVSTGEVVEQLSEFRYSPIILHLHYLVADPTGSIIIVEYNGGSFEFHSADETGIPVLSNNNYQESLCYLSRFKGFGGDLEVKNRPGSNERFVTIAQSLQCYKNEDPIEYSFSLLNSVNQPDTRWSIVYDVEKLEVHFKFHNDPSVKTFDFRSMLARPVLFSLGCDLTGSHKEFSVITAAMNAASLYNVFSRLSIETGGEPDYDLLYRMTRAGNRYLQDSIYTPFPRGRFKAFMPDEHGNDTFNQLSRRRNQKIPCHQSSFLQYIIIKTRRLFL